jgi:hypothetical protein
MSSPTTESHPTPAPAGPQSVRPFDAEELAALDREDVQAGKVMARLLCFFFLYTIVVTVIAAWWTWDAIR